VFGKRVLGRGEGRVWRCFLTGCWREERRGCAGVWEQGAGERGVQFVRVFVKRMLEIGEDRLWRCFE